MRDTPIIIGPEQLRDQKERMVEEYDIPEEEAEKVFSDVKTQVMLQSQEAGQDWSNETIEAVTNLVIAVQQQQQIKRNRRRQHFYDRLYNLIGAATIAGAAAVTSASAYIGDYIGAFIAGVVLVGLIYIHSKDA